MMTVVIESDYVISPFSLFVYVLHMRSDWFFLVFVTFWQIIHCSL